MSGAETKSLRIALEKPAMAPGVWYERTSEWGPEGAAAMLRLAELDAQRRLRDIALSIRRFDLREIRAAASGLACLFHHFGAPRAADIAGQMSGGLEAAIVGYPLLESAVAQAFDQLRQELARISRRRAAAA